VKRLQRAPPHPTVLDPRQAPSCRGKDPELFFPESGVSAEPARQVCRTCPFLDACGEWALDVAGLQGVWGAMTHRERVAERAARNRASTTFDNEEAA
jgi:WhiB family transcriptional regulator, redox-sensing transcriptional regulator